MWYTQTRNPTVDSSALTTILEAVHRIPSATADSVHAAFQKQGVKISNAYVNKIVGLESSIKNVIRGNQAFIQKLGRTLNSADTAFTIAGQTGIHFLVAIVFFCVYVNYVYRCCIM